MNKDKPVSIYLDQNHWIHLGQASTGHPTGEKYRKIYDYLRRHKKGGRIVCPLSCTHYQEVHATGSYKQRTDVANVMAELSSFKTITTASALQKAEIEHALNKHFGKPVEPRLIKPFGLGVNFACSGQTKILRFTGTEGAVESLAKAVGGKDKVRQLEDELGFESEFELLRGPHENQVQNLRDKYGYAPEYAEAIMHKRAAQEEGLAKQLIADPSQKNNLDNIVSARYLYWELNEPLSDVLGRIGMTTEDFMTLGRDGITQFICDIPTANVLTTFTKANLKNLHRAWKKNDVHDMDALAVAVPYCDIVITEKHAYTQLLKARVEEKYQTKLLKRLEDLPDALGELLC